MATDGSAPLEKPGQPEQSEQSALAAFSGVLALDGPSGTGKSTVARRVATRLGARYLDTGAMYRAATLAVLGAGVDPADTSAVVRIVNKARIDVATDPREPAVWLDGRRVDTEIRSGPVTSAVSAVSALPDVRATLVAVQRALIGTGAIVVEGRDIGTVVWPRARPKVYLTADVAVRARRRAVELGEKSAGGIAAVSADLQQRDRYDSTRATSPLVAAADAIELDTTYLSIDEAVNKLVDMALAVMADSRP